LIATAVLAYTDRQVLSLLVDPVRGELGLADAHVSLLLGPAFAIVYGVAGIPLGFLADRTSRRMLIFFGITVWSLGTLACGLAHDFSELFASRIAVGLGEAVLSPAAISLISDYFPPRRRGTAVGFFLSGIAMGSGAAILIGGGALQLIERGVFAATPFAHEPPWRLVLLLIGGPGVLWAWVILLIREPVRRDSDQADATTRPPAKAAAWGHVTPLYIMLAAASFVDNAVGAWAPSLLIRNFGKDPAQIGVELGILLTAGFGCGVLAGGALADHAGKRGDWSRKLWVCLYVGIAVVPVAWLMNSPTFIVALLGVPLYFALSGMVTAVGFSSILDVVPNRSRGTAMAVSFFLNVALGAGLGAPAVSFAAAHLSQPAAGLGLPLAATASAGYATAVLAVCLALARVTASRAGEARTAAGTGD
jgi:MFS family permease